MQIHKIILNPICLKLEGALLAWACCTITGLQLQSSWFYLHSLTWDEKLISSSSLVPPQAAPVHLFQLPRTAIHRRKSKNKHGMLCPSSGSQGRGQSGQWSLPWGKQLNPNWRRTSDLKTDKRKKSQGKAFSINRVVLLSNFWIQCRQ